MATTASNPAPPAAATYQDPDTQHSLFVRSVLTWLGGGFMPVYMPYVQIGPQRIELARNALKVYDVAGNGLLDGQVVRWKLYDDKIQDRTANNKKEDPTANNKKEDPTTNFWVELCGDNPAVARHWQGVLSGLPRKPRPIYLEGTGGGMFGEWMTRIIHGAGSPDSLFIQAYGHRNRQPCLHCEHLYRTWLVPRRDEQHYHTMWPFLECVSLRGYRHGICSNCAFHDGAECSYEEARCLPDRAAWRATADQDSDDGLDDGSAPTLAPRRFSPARMDKETLKDLHEEEVAEWQRGWKEDMVLWN